MYVSDVSKSEQHWTSTCPYQQGHKPSIKETKLKPVWGLNRKSFQQKTVSEIRKKKGT